ncbi:MAG: DUF3438 family protein [Pseudomonadota bacterium]
MAALTRNVFLLACILFSGTVVAPEAAGQGRPPGAERIIDSLDLKDAKVLDAVRIISELTKVNIFATRAAGEKDVSLFVRQISVHNAIDSLSRVAGLWYRYNRGSGAYLIMTAEEYQDDIIIFREDFSKVFTLRYQNVSTTAQVIEALFGARVELTLETEDDDDVLEEEAIDNFGSAFGGAQTSNRRFSRDNRRGFTNQRFRGRGGQIDEIFDPLENRQLSTEQLSSLLPDSLTGIPQIGEQAVSELIRREPPIFVTVNRLHNLLFVRTSDENAMIQIEELVAESDRPTPQVLLEMKILSLDIGDGFRSLFDLDIQSTSTTTVIDAAGNPVQVPEFDLGFGNFPSEGGTLAFQFINDVIAARLELLESENRVNVLGTPLVLASNTKPAQIFIGEERILTTGFVNDTEITTLGGTVIGGIETETELRDIGTTLRIVPTINGDRTVTMRIEQDTSSINPDSQTIPVVANNGTVTEVPVDSVNTANIVDTIVAKDGLAVAIGGLVQTETRNTESKVPFLGDIPVLGFFFRRQETQDIKSELILLITPHVFTTPEEAEQVSRDRMAELSSNPELERFGFGASKNQQQPANREDVGRFIALARFAARSLAGEEIQSFTTVEVPLRSTRPVSLLPEGDLEFAPIRSWREAGLYVTAVEVINNSPAPVELDVSKILGQWLAVSFEGRVIAPAASSEAENYMYLISDQPFGEASYQPLNLSNTAQRSAGVL